MRQITIDDIRKLNGKPFFIYLANDNIPVKVSKANLIIALTEFSPKMAANCKYLVTLDETQNGYFISN